MEKVSEKKQTVIVLKIIAILIISLFALVSCKSFDSSNSPKEPTKETKKSFKKAEPKKKDDTPFDLSLMSGEVSSHHSYCEITLPKSCKKKFAKNKTVSRFVTNKDQCKRQAYLRYSECRNNVKNPNLLVNYVYYETDETTQTIQVKDSGDTSKVCFLRDYKCTSKPKKTLKKSLKDGRCD